MWGDVSGLRAAAAAAAASWSLRCDGTVLDRPWDYAPGELDAVVEDLTARLAAGEVPPGWDDDAPDGESPDDGTRRGSEGTGAGLGGGPG